MTEFFALIFSAAIMNNLAMTHLVGLDLQLAGSKAMRAAWLIGLATLANFIVIFPLSHLLVHYFIQPLSLEYLSLFFLVLSILVTIYLLQNMLVTLLPMLSNEILSVTPLLIMNSTLLGSVLFYQTKIRHLLDAVVYALAHGSGFLLLLLMICCLRERIDDNQVPLAFRDIPILLISLGIFSMGLTGLTGLS